MGSDLYKIEHLFNEGELKLLFEGPRVSWIGYGMEIVA